MDALAARAGGLNAQGRPGSTAGRWLPCRVTVTLVSVAEGPGGGGEAGGKCCLFAFLFCLASWQRTHSLVLCLTHDLPDQLCLMQRLYTHCLGGLKPKYHFLRPLLINVKTLTSPLLAIQYYISLFYSFSCYLESSELIMDVFSAYLPNQQTGPMGAGDLPVLFPLVTPESGTYYVGKKVEDVYRGAGATNLCPPDAQVQEPALTTEFWLDTGLF